MTTPITRDPDLRLMETLAAMLELDDPSFDQKMEAGSPLSRMLALPLAEQEQRAEQLLAGWFAAKGLDVTGSGSSEFDRFIHGYRVEVKFSTLWKNGFYKFQQIRDQEYDAVVCLGISPFDAHCWVLPKELLREYVIGHMGQHGGRAARDTDWITVYPAKPPTWLSGRGGRLREAYQALRKLGPGPYASIRS